LMLEKIHRTPKRMFLPTQTSTPLQIQRRAPSPLASLNLFAQSLPNISPTPPAPSNKQNNPNTVAKP
jgi:hypothetical protein